MIVALALIVGTNAYRSYQAFRAQALDDVRAATALAVSEVDAQNRHTAALVMSIASAQIEGGMLGDRPRTLAFLRAVLESNPMAQGTYVGYEPNADGNDGKADARVPKEALGPEGRFLPYWRRDRESAGGYRLEPLVDMENYPDFLYYLGPKLRWERTNRREVLFTKPYTYEGTAMIETVFPLVRDGRFVGIAGVDRTLAQIDRTLDLAASRIDADCFLVTTSMDGVSRYIAATTDRTAPEASRLQSRDLRGTPLERTFDGAPRTPGVVTVVEARDPVTNEWSFYGLARVPSSDWVLMTRRSTSSVFARLSSLVAQNTATAIAGAGLVAVVFFLVARRVSRRLSVATAAAGRIAEGDLRDGVQRVDGSDETASLLNAFSAMNDNLTRMVQNLRRVSIQVNSTANEIGATALQQEEMANGFSSSATEVAAATQEISATGAELVRTMDAIAESAFGAASKASEGRENVRTMHDAMRRLDDAAHSVSTKLGVINEKAGGITAILATITKIAEQTNLLSVNAAIEAEKAGELGLGFLVVAREIRRLADQTSEATLDIDRVIRQMQAAVSGGVMEMDRFAESLRLCVEEGDAVARRLEGIAGHVEKDTSRVGQVTEGMRAQAAGVKQIDEAMRSLSAAARRSTSSAGEFSKAASGLRDSIGYLKDAVASFRLPDA